MGQKGKGSAGAKGFATAANLVCLGIKFPTYGRMAKCLTGLIKTPARATAYRASRLFNIYVAPLQLSQHPFRFVPFRSSLLFSSSSLLFVCASRSTARTKCNQNNCHQTNLARCAWSLCPICVSCFVHAHDAHHAHPPSAATPCQRRHFAPVIRDVNKSFLHNFVKRILQFFFRPTLFRSLSALAVCSLFATCLLYFALELLLLWLLSPVSHFPLRRETFLIMSRPWAKQGQAAPLKPRNSRTLRPK